MYRHLPACSLLLLLACEGGELGLDDEAGGAYEGDAAGECADGADNDRDGDFDCDDDGCGGSPDCDGGGPVDSDEPAVGPELHVKPSVIDAGVFPLDCVVPVLPRLQNRGTEDLSIGPLEVEGIDAGAWTLTTPGPYTLKPGEEVELEVVFQAFQDGVYDEASLRVRSNDADEGDVAVPMKATVASSTRETEVFTQPELEPIDLLWVIDTSCSMGAPVKALADAVASYFEPLLTGGVGDWQMGVTTADMDATGAKGRLVGSVITPNTKNALDVFSDQIRQPINGSPDEMGLAASKAALSAPLNLGLPNSALVRPDARLAVVVLSDENDASVISDTAYVSWLTGLKADPSHVTFSGLVPPGDRSCPINLSYTGAAAPAYHHVIRETGGVWGDFCRFEVYRFLAQMTAVAAGLEISFPLALPPVGGASGISVEVDGQPLDQGPLSGWTYDSTAQAVVFWGYGIPVPGAQVEISYEATRTCP